MTADFKSACRHVYGRLATELSPQITYHSLFHTRGDVVPSAQRLAKASRLNKDECLILLTAALFHDTGFLRSYQNHEQHSKAIARETLPRYGYTSEQIEQIAAVIEATRLPQRPIGLLQELICDADLDLLGRSDFLTLNRRLLTEIQLHTGRVIAEETWLTEQMHFLENHKFFTAAAAEQRNAGKARNLSLIRAIISSHNGSSPALAPS